ncbi:MAG: hypothetical protein J6V90_09455 [Treponema sp.]|nr:hypothetical protein [Treponema sp.]
MKSMFKTRLALFALFAAAFVFAACSSMMEDLKPTSVPLKPLNIIGAPTMQNPAPHIIDVKVDGVIAPTPKPKAVYAIALPGGGERLVEVEGTVTDNGDGTSTLTFNLDDPNPIDPQLSGGSLPVTVKVPGYAPASLVPPVNYIPEPQVSLNPDSFPNGGYDTDADGKVDTFDVYNSQTGSLGEPKVDTNYRDNIDVTKEYTDQSGNPIPDLDGDGDSDWDDVKKYLESPANDGKSIKIKVTATPNPNCGSGSDWPPATAECSVMCKEDKPITSAMVTPAKVKAGMEATATAYVGGAVCDAPTVSWQWYLADGETSPGSAIEGATAKTYTPSASDDEKYLYAVATQTVNGSVLAMQVSNRVYIQFEAGIQVDIELVTFMLVAVDKGSNVFDFTVTTNVANPTINWYVDGVKKHSGGTAYSLDLSGASYQVGAHSVQAVCVRNGALYSAQAVVKKTL